MSTHALEESPEPRAEGLPKDQPTLTTRRSFLRAGLGLAVAGGVAALGYAETNMVRITRSTLRLKGWSAGPFKLALLADLHVNTPNEAARVAEAARLAVQEAPEAVLIAGDFVTKGARVSPRLLAEAFAPLGEHSYAQRTFAVLGNHDYWQGELSVLLSTMERLPLRLLRNQSASNGEVTIAGIDDPMSGQDDYSFLYGLPGGAPVIALMHEPDYVDRLPPGVVSLQLSGHSHGGQVCLPFGMPIVLPRGARRYVSGFYPAAHTPLYVSRGIGVTGLPVRAFCPPELAILTIEGAA